MSEVFERLHLAKQDMGKGLGSLHDSKMSTYCVAFAGVSWISTEESTLKRSMEKMK